MISKIMFNTILLISMINLPISIIRNTRLNIILMTIIEIHKKIVNNYVILMFSKISLTQHC